MGNYHAEVLRGERGGNAPDLPGPYSITNRSFVNIMLNDPEWASEEEWDIYAWFGFAMQEAQAIEQMLFVITAALDMKNGKFPLEENHWAGLYDKFGRLTLGQLLSHIRKHSVLSKSLEDNIKKAVIARNKLAHAFFLPNSHKGEESALITSQKRLMDAASLFSNLKPQLENIMGELLFNLTIERNSAEKEVEVLLDDKNKKYGWVPLSLRPRPSSWP